MIRGYVSSDEEDEYEFGYSEPLVRKKDPPRLPLIQTKEVREELNAALEDGRKISSFLRAVADGDLIALMEIVESGVDVDTAAPQEWTALMKACQMGNFEVVQFLLERGSNPNLHKELFTPLMVCCNYTIHDEDAKLSCVRLLIQHGADVNLRDKFRTTALMYAIGSGYLNIVDELLGVPGIDINIQDKEGWTALFYAVYHSYIDVVKKLVSAGCDQTPKDRYGRTALNLALDKDLKEIAVVLGYTEETDLQEPKQEENIHSLSQFLKELPSSSGKGGFPLDAKEILAAFNQFNVKSVSLPDFLNMTDEDLYNIGVKLEHDRHKILVMGIHKYHMFPWKKSAMHQILYGVPISMEDAVAITGNLVKHLTIANASLRYLRNRISSRLNADPQDLKLERELISNLVNSYTAINKIKTVLKRILSHIEKIKPNYPGDYVYHRDEEKKPNFLKKYFWHALSVSTTGYLIYCLKTKPLKIKALF